MAQAYPAKPIRVIMPATAGSGIDLVGRIVMQKMALNMGHPFLADNIPGAAGNVATAALARSAPDGYTILVLTESLVLSALVYSKLPFALKDVHQFGTIAKGVWILTVNASFPANSVQELVRIARAKPGSIAYGSSGFGSPHQVVMEMFAQAAGIQLLHVPYNGSASTVTSLLGGQIQAAMGFGSSFMSPVASGKFRALGVSSAQRVRTLPDVPTIAESGFPGVEYETWYSLLAPAGTPQAVLERLHAELGKVLRDQAYFAEKLAPLGLEPFESPSVEAAANLVKTYHDRLAPIIKKAGIKVE